MMNDAKLKKINFISQNSGFTLIEMLVVITIIGMLSSIVMTSINVSRIKARGVKIVSEMRSIQQALELYKSDFGTYPTVTSGGTAIGGNAFSVNGVQIKYAYSCNSNWTNLKNVLSPYINLPTQIPIQDCDDSVKRKYYYYYDQYGDGYKLLANNPEDYTQFFNSILMDPLRDGGSCSVSGISNRAPNSCPNTGTVPICTSFFGWSLYTPNAECW